MNIVPEEKTEPIKNLKCGIVMPISPTFGYPKEHWNDVLEILESAVKATQFLPSIVSTDAAVGLIHQRIVTNLYDNEIIICDVSSKNPNVMFELGLRLAFDKPTIIIKDDKTDYSFDVGGIEHLNYPSSLRFAEIVDFKTKLVFKINSTYEASKNDKGYSPFLKSFGKRIVPAKIHGEEITEARYIIEALRELQTEFNQFRIGLTKVGTSININDDLLSNSILDVANIKGATKEEIYSYVKDVVKNADLDIDNNAILAITNHAISRTKNNKALLSKQIMMD